MRALSIRQLYAEQILRGPPLKTIEYRSRPTRIIGERFYIYAARKPGPAKVFQRIAPAPFTGSAEVNANGTVNIDDLVRMIVNWTN